MQVSGRVPAPPLPAPPLPGSKDDWALFLDVDGTLANFAPRPDQVVIDKDLLNALGQLDDLMTGALAIVSGRPIDQIDSLFAPLVLPAGGLHGLERRTKVPATDTMTTERPAAPAWHGEISARLNRFADAHAGAWVEDKKLTLALHYRGAPELKEVADALARTVEGNEYADLVVQTGKMIVEFRPGGADKGDVIDYFLTRAPFAGRRPVFVGDDTTDEDGFRAVKRANGYAIRVGNHTDTAADWCLPTIEAAQDWIMDMARLLRAQETLEKR